MYQTVGHDGINLYSESLGLPLFRRVISGNAVIQDKEYSPTHGDEVEDLFCLLNDIKVRGIKLIVFINMVFMFRLYTLSRKKSTLKEFL